MKSLSDFPLEIIADKLFICRMESESRWKLKPHDLEKMASTTESDWYIFPVGQSVVIV
jgi:hypothetical protein